jgi:hypothetical protein
MKQTNKNIYAWLEINSKIWFLLLFTNVELQFESSKADIWTDDIRVTIDIVESSLGNLCSKIDIINVITYRDDWANGVSVKPEFFESWKMEVKNILKNALISNKKLRISVQFTTIDPY